MTIKQEKRIKRHRRIRAKISGTPLRPRLSVFRTPRHIYAQLIDDQKRKTLLSVKSRDLKVKKTGGKTQLAFAVGEAVAEKAIKSGIETVVFDRGGYLFHGRVKAVAEGAKKGGLKI